MSGIVKPLRPVNFYLPGYQVFEPIFRGSNTTVCRAFHTNTQRPVVIKFLTQNHPNFSRLTQFSNQYTVAKNLPIEGVVRPLSLTEWGNSYALVMDDFGGVDLGQYAQQNPLNFITILEWAIQLTSILGELHQHRVIHKDIKPSNILIHPASKQLKLIDFSIASLLPKESQTLQNPKHLEGSLAYLAPEQTGRMNRGIDYRTDFYALGVTLYELLAGQLPFTHQNPLELIHAHMAQMPPAANQVNPDIPEMVAAIVAKLMAKNAEDRYQSSFGLNHDLQHCLHQWTETGTVSPFELGQRDVSDRFLISEKLYGRELEVQTLMDAFERVSQGASELILVAGFSGVGKTAVVNEVHKPITRQKGYFIKGKYDQFNRNLPFSAFVQALQDLMKQLLSEGDRELQTWRTRILLALGDNAQVIIDLIPDLQRIIGPQPAAPDLSGTAAQNRFNLLFQRFIRVFAAAEHPLTLFLDDLQWADSASLKLIQVLVSETQTNHLLVLGAYRDNEVFPSHPLMVTLADITKAGATTQAIALQPLRFESLNQLISETLHASENVVKPLTELVMQKTKGNPFFATQFLHALHQDQLVTFEPQAGYWHCDIVKIKEAALTEDVVAFMAAQLGKLPNISQDMLKLAACMGAQFDLETLTIMAEQSPMEVASALWPALQAGLLLPQSEIYKFYLDDAPSQAHRCHATDTILNYKFLHDRVQQAAYSLIAEEERPQTHLKMGQLLLHHYSPQERQERLFDIVNHLNMGGCRATPPQDCEQLTALNLEAGQKAKAATAYDAAMSYFSTGINLIQHRGWENHYELALTLHNEIAETSYLNTDFSDVERWADVVLANAQTLLDTIKVQQTRIMGIKAQGQPLESIQLGLQVLKTLGIEFPENPTQADIEQAHTLTRSLWAERSPLELLELPTLQDIRLIAAMDILTVLVPAAYVASPNLMMLLIFKQVELSITSGNTSVSIFAYGDYGFILCCIMEDISNGFEFGQLASSLLEKLQKNTFKGRSWYVINAYIKHWKLHLSNVIPAIQEAYTSSLDSGDLESLGWNASVYGSYMYHAGWNLTETVEVMEICRQTTTHYKLAFCLPYQQICQQTVINLLGDTEEPYELSGDIFNRASLLPQLQESNQRSSVFSWYFNQSFLYYLFGKHQEALQSIAQASEYLDGVTGTFTVPLYSWFDALIQLAIYPTLSTEKERDTSLNHIQEHHKKLRHWATLSPANHQHRWELVEAESCRILDQPYKAGDYYDRAIASSKANNFVQDEALANELAAKFYIARGKHTLATDYMRAAYYCYSRWGAKAKTEHLEQNYPELLSQTLQSQELFSPLETLIDVDVQNISSYSSKSSISSNMAINAFLDFTSLLKTSQLISEIINIDDLLIQVSQLILKNSGADSLAILLLDEDSLKVRALAKPGATKLSKKSLSENSNLPIQLIQYVKNTQEIIAIDDLDTELPITDDYLLQQKPRSVLCIPLLHQGNLTGLLYLQNQETAGTFTRDRITVISLLCCQAAISLENAQLYQTLKRTQFAVDKAALGVFWIREDGLILEVNESACSDLGYSYTELKGCHVWEINPAMHPHEWHVYVDNARNQSFTRYEVNHQRKDGSIFPVEVIAKFLEYEGQGCIFTQVQDISDRKQAEAELKTVTERLSLALKSGDLGYWQWTIATNELYWEDRLYELHGVPTGELNFNVFRSTIHPDDIQPFDELVQSAIANTTLENELGSSNPYEVIYRAVCSSEAVRYLKTYGTVLRNHKGEATGMIGITFNITHFKLAEEQLELSNRELKRASEMKDEFLATMSHELRTPLNAVLGMTDILLAQAFGSINSKQLNALQTIEKSSTHLLQLINDILDLSKISAAKTELSLKFIHVAQLCHASLQLIQPQAQAKHLRVFTIIPENLPPIQMDEQRIRQVLVNLLSNAVKFTPEHGEITLIVRSTPIPDPTGNSSHGFLRVTVSDTGIGIPPKHMEKLFQPFIQIDSALNRQYDGTGLGLALVKQIVDLHGGHVSVTSEVSIGSSFSVDLPWIAPETPQTQVSTATDDLPIMQLQPQKNPTILLVEDDPASTLTIASYLEVKGYSLALAQNGQEAIECCQSMCPDIILMDIQMPGMDGLEATKYIRQNLGMVDIPIIALTALAMTGDRERCIEAGATEYLSKPIRLRQFTALLDTYLST